MQLRFWEVLTLLMEFEIPGKLTPEDIEYWERHLPLMPKKMAYKKLKDISGQDFGDDTDAWREWFEEHETELLEKRKDSDGNP